MMTTTAAAIAMVLNSLSESQGREVRGERRKFGHKGESRNTTSWPRGPVQMGLSVENVQNKRLIQPKEECMKKWWLEPPVRTTLRLESRA